MSSVPARSPLDGVEIPDDDAEWQRLLRDDPALYMRALLKASFEHGAKRLSEGRKSTDTGKWNWIGGPPSRRLDHACDIVRRAFGDVPYHVGSAMTHENWRDIDVRVIMDDERFDMLFGRGSTLTPFWSLLCTAISEYLSRLTELPIDFQVQRHSAVTDAEWDKPRNPLAIWPDYTDDTSPAWHRPCSSKPNDDET